MFPKITEEKVEQLLDEYEEYTKEKHSLPFPVWLKYVKKLDTKAMNEVRRLAYEH